MENFKEYCKNIPDDPPEFLTQFWQERITNIENQFNGDIPDDFLCNKDIQFTMFVRYDKYTPIELHYLVRKYPFFKLVGLLAEGDTGKLPIMNIEGIKTTGNSIHMLYHLSRYAAETETYLSKINSVVEWGGGFGNLCKIFWKLHSNFKTYCTYTLIDTKLFTYLQWLYLSENLGQYNVNIGSIKKGMINIIPLGMLDKVNISAELFISTWAISESSDTAQQYVMDKKLFNAKKVLIAHQGNSSDFPFADSVKEFVDGKVYSEEIEHLPGNYYLFK